MTDLPDILRYYGFADETVRGTAETTPEMYIDIKSQDLGLPDDAEMEWEGSIGRGKTTHRPGYFVMKPKFEGGMDVQIMRKMLYYVLGNKVDVDSDTDADTMNDTETSYLWSSNKVLLPTYTAFQGIDLEEWIVPGNTLDQLEIAVSNEFLTLKGDPVATGLAPGTFKTEENITLNNDYPIAFYEIDVHMRPKGSVTAWGPTNLISSEVQKLTLTFKNNADDKAGQGLGKREPYNVPVAKREFGIKYDSNYLSNKYIELLLGGSTGFQEKVGSTEVEMLVKFDFGTFGSAQLFYPRVVPTKTPLDSKGKDQTTQSLEFDAYEETVTIPTTVPQVVKTDVLATIVRPIPEV